MKTMDDCAQPCRATWSASLQPGTDATLTLIPCRVATASAAASAAPPLHQLDLLLGLWSCVLACPNKLVSRGIPNPHCYHHGGLVYLSSALP